MSLPFRFSKDLSSATQQNATKFRSFNQDLKFPTQEVSGCDFGANKDANIVDASVLDRNNSAEKEPQNDDLDVIMIDPCDYREDFKEGHYDIVLIYSEKDRMQALTFREILTKFIILEDHSKPSVCVLDQNIHLSHINSKFVHMEEALKRSTYMFVFLTKHFCEDSWAQLQRDEVLMEAIDNPEKKWCVVPILTKPRREADYQLPFGLRALKGVEISHVLHGKTLETVDVDTLQEKEVDVYFRKNMSRMLSARIRLKREREKKQELEFKEWLKEEKQRRWKMKVKEQARMNLANKYRHMERINFIKEMENYTNEKLAVVADVAMNAAIDEVNAYRNLNKNAKRNLQDQPPALTPSTNEASVVHHHYHNYGNCNIYNINGSTTECAIGSNNALNIGSGEHVELDGINVETDSPEFVVVEDSSTPPDNQSATGGIRSVFKADDKPNANVVKPQQMPTNEMMLASDQRSQSSVASNSPDYMAFNADALKCSPEVDRPLSPLYERMQDVTGELGVLPGHKVLMIDGRKNAVANNAIDMVEKLTTTAVNTIHADNTGTSGSFPNEFSPDRPMAAVPPIRQTSQPVLNKVDDDDEKENEETDVKPVFDNKETVLETLHIAPNVASKKVERPVTEEEKIDEQHVLEKTDDFVMVERHEIGIPSIIKEWPQVDGPAKTKSQKTGNLMLCDSHGTSLPLSTAPPTGEIESDTCWGMHLDKIENSDEKKDLSLHLSNKSENANQFGPSSKSSPASASKNKDSCCLS